MSEYTNFYLWKHEIENHVIKYIGFKLDELPDQPYRDWFHNNKINPLDASKIILDNHYSFINLLLNT